MMFDCVGVFVLDAVLAVRLFRYFVPRFGYFLNLSHHYLQRHKKMVSFISHLGQKYVECQSNTSNTQR